MKHLKNINEVERVVRTSNTQSIFDSNDKYKIGELMADIKIEFNKKYHDVKKNEEIYNFLETAMDDVYKIIINILEEKKSKKK